MSNLSAIFSQIPSEDTKRAMQLKNQGNKLLLEKSFSEAIKLYSQAIELDPTKAVYFTNRAYAYMNLESYRLAIEDASKAISIDPSYLKAYYRRAIAYTATLRYSDALKDYRTIIKHIPNDFETRRKAIECEKIIRRIKFEKAIDVGEESSATEGIDFDAIVIKDDYDGERLGESMTLEFINDMISRFSNGKKIHLKYVYQIILSIKKILSLEPTMIEVDIKSDHILTICGDIHGQYFDLLEIFRLNGKPSETNRYLFNGDFVDRGSWSTEVVLLLYAYKWLYPTGIFLNRGNHETDDMNKIYGFEGECKAKYTERTFKLFSESFNCLPLATLIGSTYLVIHGGLFSDDNVTLNDIRNIDRISKKQPGNTGLMMEILWTDPQPSLGRGPSKRGVGLQFGPDVTKKFVEANNLKAIIRSHEVKPNGYEVEHNGYCITVFSAPNYCDTQGNKGAYIRIGPSLELEFKTFDAVPHPNIPPMKYATGLISIM
ncbi:hypothetical protein MERGE_000749 [Pneumocystis wakefieldiae]|uniref:Serine/threonine-protein phosphatase n=1 Tax=Pneumocystis wakefieldiae TaxID=38082 RepID=A0A899FX46_9ASCO|nr:hypothetical protein MERGE_000749 [Pneumocystis wakefieldiae]